MQASVFIFSLSVHIMPCRCMFSVPLCPISVISQCLKLPLYFFRHRSKNSLIAFAVIALSSWYPISFFSIRCFSLSSAIKPPKLFRIDVGATAYYVKMFQKA